MYSTTSASVTKLTRFFPRALVPGLPFLRPDIQFGQPEAHLLRDGGRALVTASRLWICAMCQGGTLYETITAAQMFWVACGQSGGSHFFVPPCKAVITSPTQCEGYLNLFTVS